MNVSTGAEQQQGKQEGEQHEDDQQEQVSQSEEGRAALESFEAGFKRVHHADKDAGSTTEGTTTATDTTAGGAAANAEDEATAKAAAEAKAKAEAEAEAAAAAQREWESLPKVVRDRLDALSNLPDRLRGIEGHIGGLKSKLEGAIATAKAAADESGKAKPSDAQIQEALEDDESFKQFETDYPDFAKPIRAQILAMRKTIAGANPVNVDQLRTQITEDVGAQLSNVIDIAEERAVVRIKHPGWKNTVRTDEFKTWLEGQPDDMKARAKSALADDAIAMLDGFEAHREQARKTAEAAQQAEQERLRKKKRIEDAMPATRGSAAAPADNGLSNEDAFTRGFKRARGK